METRVQRKFVVPASPTEWLLDRNGLILCKKEMTTDEFAYQIDWDGDRSQDELMRGKTGVFQWKEGNFETVIRIDVNRRTGVTGDWRTNAYYPIPIDITGDPREEIIVWDQDEIIILKNSVALNYEIPTYSNNSTYKMRYVNMDYHTNAFPYFDY